MNDLLGKTTILRPLQASFIDEYLAQFSDAVRRALRVSALESERRYLEEQLLQENSYFYCIFNKDNQLLGAIAIRNKELYAAGQLYSWLNENYWGLGYYQEALQLLSEYYFTVTNQQYYTAQVDTDNIRSYKALKKAGFADIGIAPGPHGKQYQLILRRK